MINEVDLSFESHFDANLRNAAGIRKESSLQNFTTTAMQSLRPGKMSSEESAGGGGFGSANTIGAGNVSPNFGGLGGLGSLGNILGSKQNRGFGTFKNVSHQLTFDYED